MRHVKFIVRAANWPQLGETQSSQNKLILLQPEWEMDCEDDTCAGVFEQCGGNGFNTSIACCDPAASCVVKVR